jgi:putative hydrolase of the HAD superfamily
VTDDRVTALLIDLDGTLIDGSGWHETLESLDQLGTELADTASDAVSSAMIRRLDDAWDEESVAGDFRRLGFAMSDALWSTFIGAGPALARIRAWVPGFRARFWSEVSVAAGIADVVSSQELALRYAEERAARIRALPDVSVTLERLRDDFRMVLLSNGPTDLQRQKMKRTGLDGWFDAIIISGEVGCAKPQAGAFSLALAAAGCSAAQAVMVGDDWTNDVLGALAVGVRAVHIDPGRRRPVRGDLPHSGVESLECFGDLSTWIDGGSGRGSASSTAVVHAVANAASHRGSF